MSPSIGPTIAIGAGIPQPADAFPKRARGRLPSGCAVEGLEEAEHAVGRPDRRARRVSNDAAPAGRVAVEGDQERWKSREVEAVGSAAARTSSGSPDRRRSAGRRKASRARGVRRGMSAVIGQAKVPAGRRPKNGLKARSQRPGVVAHQAHAQELRPAGTPACSGQHRIVEHVAEAPEVGVGRAAGQPGPGVDGASPVTEVSSRMLVISCASSLMRIRRAAASSRNCSSSRSSRSRPKSRR